METSNGIFSSNDKDGGDPSVSIELILQLNQEKASNRLTPARHGDHDA